MIQSDPEVWEIGQVREFIGTGIPEGLLVEIDLGDEITEEIFNDRYVTSLSFNAQSRVLTAKRSANLSDLTVAIPVGLELVKANWNETDPTNPAFILNKPNLNFAQAFTDLTDVIDENYLGKAGCVPMVRAQEDKMYLEETEEIETAVAKSTLLSDFPQSLTGFGGYSLRVKQDQSGWELFLP